MATEQMSLCQVRELATRQQEHIEATQRLIIAREHKFKCLKQNELPKSNHQLFEHEEKFNNLRESVTAQEIKLRQLRAMKGQVQKQRCLNSNLSSELESIRALFSEKEKELSVAFAKVDALTRQLEELRKGNTTNSYHINGIANGKHTIELEKLRQELLYRTKVSEQQSQDLAHKKGLLAQRQSEMIQIDERISELQQRLARKRQINQQLSSQMHSNLNRNNNNNNNNNLNLRSSTTVSSSEIGVHGMYGPNSILRSSIGHSGHGHKLRPLSANIAAVEPLQRDQENDPLNGNNNDFLGSKMDPKYQTLPYNVKFGSNKHHKINNHFNELNNTNNNNNMNKNESEFSNNNINGIVTNNNVNNNNNITTNGNITGSISTNGLVKLTKPCLMEERPSPSGSSCSSEHTSLSHQIQSHNPQHHHVQNQIQNFNSRLSPFKLNNNNSGNNSINPNNNAQHYQQYYQQQKQYQNQYIQQQQQPNQAQIQRKQPQQLQQNQPQQHDVALMDNGNIHNNSNNNNSNNKVTTTNLLSKQPQQQQSQKCHQIPIPSQNYSVPTTLSPPQINNQQNPNQFISKNSLINANAINNNNNNNSKPKPMLPPKPSVPVKPVPPPRQTPSIDSVDNAISILKANTANFDKRSLMTNTSSGTGQQSSLSPSSENYRYQLTTMSMQRATPTTTAYNANSKSGLITQQLPRNQNQSLHYNHQHNQQPYEDKVPTMTNNTNLNNNNNTNSNNNKKNQEQTTITNINQDFSNLNGQTIIGSDVTSSTSSLSSSLSSAYNITATNNNYNSSNNNNNDTNDIKSKSTSNNNNNNILNINNTNNNNAINDNENTSSNQMITKNNINNKNNLIDWHKVKRRPMVMDNEMENELAMQIDVATLTLSPNNNNSNNNNNENTKNEQIITTHSQQSIDSIVSIGLDQTNKSKETNNNNNNNNNSRVTLEKSKEIEKGINDDEINANHEQIEQAGCALIDQSQTQTETERSPSPQLHSNNIVLLCETPEILSPSGKNCVGGIKRTKGNLKSQQHGSSLSSSSSLSGKVDISGSAGSTRTSSGSCFGGGNTISRRVSFDPLALLLDAALEGELELVKKTAKEVPNPSAANDEGITALHNAICAGHFDIVKYLVETGCDVNAQDSDGWTPLHCAASCNNLPMVKFLVEHGACIFATTLSDEETAAEKCEEDEEGFDGCSQYLYGIQEKLGIINGGIVYAVYDYESQNPDELNFKEGDRITIMRKGDEQEREWWWSKLKDKEGYVPRNLLGLYPRVRPVKDQQIIDEQCD